MFSSTPGSQKSTRSATARSTLSSLVSASRLDATEAELTGPDDEEENDSPARIAASSLRRFSAARPDCRVTVRPMIEAAAVTSTPTKARTAATWPVPPVAMCNGPTSTTSNADAPTTTPTNHPSAHRVSLDAPRDCIIDGFRFPVSGSWSVTGPGSSARRSTRSSPMPTSKRSRSCRAVLARTPMRSGSCSPSGLRSPTGC